MAAPASSMGTPYVASAKAAFGVSRGVGLSHAIGICIAIHFLLDRVVQEKIFFWNAVEIPAYLVAAWLLLDRGQRLGGIRIGLWDYLYLGFVSAVAFGFVYAEAVLVRFSGFQNYLQFLVLTLHPYLYFVLVREASRRKGFQPATILGWFLFALAISVSMGMLQALDLLGVRAWSYEFYNQKLAEIVMDGPSKPWQARGTAQHANILAQQLWLGLAVLAGMISYRGLRKIDWLLGGLFLAGIAGTYSRSGVVTTVALIVALTIFLASRRKFVASVSVLTAGLALATVGVVLIQVFDVQRLKVLVEGEKIVRRHEDLGSLRLRAASSMKALNLAQDYPIFGLVAANGGINNVTTVTRNAFTFSGKLDNMYSHTFVMYGIVGVTFMVGVLFALIRNIRGRYAAYAFAPSAFLMGVGLMLHGATENLLFIEGMVVVNVVAALVATRVRPLSSPERATATPAASPGLVEVPR